MIPTKEMIEAADAALKSRDWHLDDDAISAALTAALSPELLSKGQWRGMESAPKQGDLLLAFSTSTNVGISTGRWAEGYWLWGYEEEPTHWMPLPPPPAQE